MRRMLFPIITEEEAKLPFYVTSIGMNDSQHHVIRPDGYPGYHFLYGTSGKGRIRIDGRDFSIPENMGFFFPPGIPHEYFAEVEPWVTWWITFDGYAVKSLPCMVKLGKFRVFSVNNMERLHQLHGEVHTSVARAGTTGCFESSHLLYRFLLELDACIGSEAVKTRHDKVRQLQPLMAFLEENYSSAVSLDDMAKVTGVTPQHLCRLFRQAYGIRPFEYLTRYRLQKAKEILVGPGNPILKETASRAGFNDTSYFCHLFRQYEGMTPMEFKRMHREY